MNDSFFDVLGETTVGSRWVDITNDAQYTYDEILKVTINTTKKYTGKTEFTVGKDVYGNVYRILGKPIEIAPLDSFRVTITVPFSIINPIPDLCVTIPFEIL